MGADGAYERIEKADAELDRHQVPGTARAAVHTALAFVAVMNDLSIAARRVAAALESIAETYKGSTR